MRNIYNIVNEWRKRFGLMIKVFLLSDLTLDQAANQLKMLNILEEDFGHKKSYRVRKSLDAKGLPMPWFTYSAIEFFNSLDLSNMVIFEFGSGIGSRYWAKNAKRVTSVESDYDWYKKTLSSKAKNQTLIYKNNKDSYVSSIKRNKLYDLIIVDGVYRKDCMEESLKYLKEDSILVLDNSEWYPKTSEMLRKKGFTQIDFCGLGPVVYFSWKTSIFIKSLNALKYKKKNYVPIGSYVQEINPE